MQARASQQTKTKHTQTNTDEATNTSLRPYTDNHKATDGTNTHTYTKKHEPSKNSKHKPTKQNTTSNKQNATTAQPTHTRTNKHEPTKRPAIRHTHSYKQPTNTSPHTRETTHEPRKINKQTNNNPTYNKTQKCGCTIIHDIIVLTRPPLIA